jgi:hypothetical protein
VPSNISGNVLLFPIDIIGTVNLNEELLQASLEA